MYLRDVDRTAVGFHERRILLSQHYSKQNISGVPGFDQAHSNRGKFGTQLKSFYDDLDSTGKVQQQFGHEVCKLGL
jgi:hypothetical protein